MLCVCPTVGLSNARDRKNVKTAQGNAARTINGFGIPRYSSVGTKRNDPRQFDMCDITADLETNMKNHLLPQNTY